MKSRLSSPALLVPVVLILAALAWFGYQYYAGVAARAADRARLLEHIAIELAKERPDSSELSRLVARIEEFPDHATAADLLGARARIELERGRPERAVELFLPVATSPAASAADRGLAAQMLLARHAGGLPSRADAVNMLEQVIAFARASYEASGDVADLMRCWLAALRLTDEARRSALGDELLADQAESAPARFVRLWRSFSPQQSIGELEAIEAEFDEPLPEFEVMHTTRLLLGEQDVEGAVARIESALARFGGVLDVRVAAALVFHACAEGSAQESAERAQWINRRNAQLDWLLAQAAPEDERRIAWAATLRMN